jgi:hypothetical protein
MYVVLDKKPGRGNRLPQAGGPGPRIYIPQALGPLLVASNDSQGYGGGIRTRLHISFMLAI